MLHGHKVSFSLVTRLYLTEITFFIPFVHPCRAESQPSPDESQQQPLRSRCHIVINVFDRNFIETSPAECYTRSFPRWTASNDQKPNLSSSKSGRIYLSISTQYRLHVYSHTFLLYVSNTFHRIFFYNILFFYN